MIALKGNGLDALVTSSILSENQLAHRLIASRERLGGHFKGYETICGKIIDLGMVLLEPDKRGIGQMDISAYQGESGSGIRPFIDEIFGWFGEALCPQDVAVDYEGRRFGDYFISDNLGFLQSLEHSAKLQSKRELLEIVRSQHHPKHKLNDDFFAKEDLTTCLTASIGPTLTFHMFNSWIKSLDPRGLTRGRDHRSLWVPLYWPETLLSALDGETPQEELKFFKLSERPFAALVRRLIEAAPLTPPSAEVHGKYLIDFDRTPRAIPAERAPYRIVHFCVAEAISSTTFYAKTSSHLTRVDFGYGSSMNSLENTNPVASLEFVGSDTLGPELLSTAQKLLESAGQKVMCSGEVISSFLPLGKLESKSRQSPYSPLRSSFGQNGQTMNDHIARGISTAKKLMMGIMK